MHRLCFWSRQYYSVSFYNPLVSEFTGGSGLMGMSVKDVRVKWLWGWVLNDLSFFSFSIFRLWASSGGANWIRLAISLDIRVKLNGESPVVTEVPFSVSKVLVSRDDITVKLGSEVVIDILGWVVPFGL
jgi:hypothetical protein